MADIDLTTDTSADTIGGSEKILVADSTTAKHITPDLLSAYIIDDIEAITTLSSCDGNDFLPIIENNDTLKKIDIDKVAQHGIDTMWGKGAETSVDDADILLLKDGGTTEKTVTAANLAVYMLAEIESDILDISGLDEIVGISDTDELLIVNGSTPKKTDFIDISDAIMADIPGHLSGLDAVVTLAGADLMYITQSGTAKKVTITQIAAEAGGDVDGPGTSTEDYIPQWTNVNNTLKDGLAVATSFSAGSDSAVPTSKGVRDEMDTIIYDSTDIGADLVDADTILVDDGAAGTTQRKCAMSRVFTYVEDKIQALSAKATPVSADILTIQDTEDSNALKEMTITNMMKALDIDGTTDIGAALADADLILVDDGAGGTNRSCAVSRVFDYIEDKIQDLSAKTTPVGADILTIQDSAASNALKELTITNLASNLPSGVVDLTALDIDGGTDIGAAIADADLIIIDDGGAGTNRKSAVTRIPTYVSTKIEAANGLAISGLDIDGATDIGADLADADLFIVDDGAGGTNRGCAASRIWTYIKENAETADYLELSGLNIDGTGDIGEALDDSDLLIVDNGGLGVNCKSEVSRVWTYVTSKIQALSAKTDLVEADILAIQDSEDSNNLKELTVTNLKSYMDLPDYYHLTWVAGQGRLPQLNASVANETADHDFEILGTNASDDDVTYYAEGGLTLETDGADGDEVIVLPHLDASQSAWTNVTWGTDQEVRWECRIRTGASITNCIIWAGLKLTNTEVTATDDDQAFFRYEDGVNGGEWQAISSIAGSDDAHDTNVAVATGTEYHLVIDIQSNRTAKFYINGTLVETSAALTDAIDLIPYIGVATDGAAEAKTLIVRGQSIRRKYA